MRLGDARDHQVREEKESHARRLAGTEMGYQQSLREERLMQK